VEPARSIARLGFKKWYERRLIEAHAWLLTALLCAIYVEAALETLRPAENPVAWMGTAAGMFVGALIAWHGLRRFGAILREAERCASQSTCGTCGTYARFDVVMPQQLMVRCRKCAHQWSIR
jgi:hypothetical protein